MPLYTWHCEHCGVAAQVIRKVADIEIIPGGQEDDDKIPPCTHESGHLWDRKTAATNFKLLGSGWFKSGGY